MEKDLLFFVYLVDKETGKRFFDSRFTWVFTDCDTADDFASSLDCLCKSRYVPHVAVISSTDCCICPK